MSPRPLTAGELVRKTLALGLLGFLFVALSGPIFTIAGFAAIGYVLYRVFQWIVRGESPPEAGAIGTGVKRIFATAFQVIRVPATFLWRIVMGAGRMATGSIWLAWNVVTEVLTGAIFGAALGVLIGVPTGFDHLTVAGGGGLGALMGLWNGVVRSWPRRAAPVPELPQCLRQQPGVC
ncbi:MAG TPA: hypothetical protein PKC45_18475 [Gemmatales bacterium]|nr:hypothetical protein [Gemmatales bacterium]